MKIKNINDLQNQLDTALMWRKKEMTTLKFRCEKKPQDPIIHKATILLIYAHWEGFIKEASIAYLEYLNSQKILCLNMSSNFLNLQLGASIAEDLTSRNFRHRQTFLDYIDKVTTQIFSINAKKSITTESNLKSEVFKKLLNQLGIPETDFALKFQLIDQKLICYRNAIAHGEKREDTKVAEVVEEIKENISTIMDTFKEKIIDAAEKQKYLKPANQEG